MEENIKGRIKIRNRGRGELYRKKNSKKGYYEEKHEDILIRRRKEQKDTST